MALSITSAAEAREIVKTLRADPSNRALRTNVIKSLTDLNWNIMVQAGYLEFCSSEVNSWKEGEICNVSRAQAQQSDDYSQLPTRIAIQPGSYLRMRSARLYKRLTRLLVIMESWIHS
jgi:hypothetical protein